jgi:hypothetical protein
MIVFPIFQDFALLLRVSGLLSSTGERTSKGLINKQNKWNQQN